MDSETKKLEIIATGKEIADFIVGSHRALNIFMAFYLEWDEHRGKSIVLLQQLADVVSKFCRESDKIADVINKLNRLADNLPDPTASLGTRIAAAIGGFFAGLFAPEMSERDVKAKEFEIKQVSQKDIDSTSQVYLYGAQCSSQFEETRRSIKALHLMIMQETHLESVIDDEDAIEFLSDIAFYNPDNVSVFYRRLKSDYEKLLKASKSAESRNFIRVFEEIPEAVQVIDLLSWYFDTDGYDVKIVSEAWKEVFDMFLNSNDFTIGLFLEKVRHCIFILKKERDILKRTKSNLLKENFKI